MGVLWTQGWARPLSECCPEPQLVLVPEATARVAGRVRRRYWAKGAWTLSAPALAVRLPGAGLLVGWPASCPPGCRGLAGGGGRARRGAGGRGRGDSWLYLPFPPPRPPALAHACVCLMSLCARVYDGVSVCVLGALFGAGSAVPWQRPHKPAPTRCQLAACPRAPPTSGSPTPALFALFIISSRASCAWWEWVCRHGRRGRARIWVRVGGVWGAIGGGTGCPCLEPQRWEPGSD